MNRVTKIGLLASLVATAWAGSVSAQSLTVGSATGQPGQSVDIVVDFEAGGGAAGYQARFTYDNTVFGVPIATNGAATCTVNDGAGEISVFRTTFPPAVIPANEEACSIEFPIDPAAPFAVYPLTVADADTRFSDTGGVESPLDNTDGEIEVVDAPPDVVLSFNPADGGTVTFPGGATQGDTVSESIDITGGGNAGTGTVDNCAFTGADAAAFSVTTAQPINVNAGANGTIDIDCTVSDEAQSATLSCDVTDSGGNSSASWTMSCPAGSPIPAPEYSSNPAPGATISCNGSAGSTVNRSITITNTGNVGVGEELDYSCSVTVGGANFAITSGASDTGIAVGDSRTVNIACTTPALSTDPDNTGTIECTTNEAGTPSYTYDLSAGVQTAPSPLPQPNIVPAGSLWSKLLLIGLLAGLGGLIVALRRQ